MDNAIQAFYMAFAMLILVLALSISISLFGQARATSSVIIEGLNDTEYALIEEDADTSRIVGIETIIPSLYRAFKENYTVRFMKEVNGNYEPLYIFQIKRGDNNPFIRANLLDFSPSSNEEKLDNNNQKIVVGNQLAAVKFVDWLVSGKEQEFRFSPNATRYFRRLHNNGVYGIINEMMQNNDYFFRETLGLYYQEDIDKGTGNTPDNQTSGNPITSTLDVNKTERRIITYTAVKN